MSIFYSSCLLSDLPEHEMQRRNLCELYNFFKKLYNNFRQKNGSFVTGISPGSGLFKKIHYMLSSEKAHYSGCSSLKRQLAGTGILQNVLALY
jgi:hypothetical protein